MFLRVLGPVAKVSVNDDPSSFFIHLQRGDCIVLWMPEANVAVCAVSPGGIAHAVIRRFRAGGRVDT